MHQTILNTTTRWFSFFLLALILSSNISRAQNISPSIKREIDSLKRQIDASSPDSTKIRLRFSVGVKSAITRDGYWDTLINDAHSRDLSLLELRMMTYRVYELRRLENKTAFRSQILKTIEFAKQKNYIAEAIDNLQTLSYDYYLQTQSKKALEYCYESLKLSEESKNKRAIARSKFLLSLIYFQMNELKKSINLQLECAREFEELKLNDQLAWVLMAIGTNYDELKDDKNVIHYYMKSAKYAYEFPETGLAASIFNSVGAAFKIQKQTDSANYYYLKSYNISKRLGNEESMVSSLYLIADNFLNAGNYKKAKIYAPQAMKLAKEINFTAQIPKLANVLKRIYINEGDYKAALEAFELEKKISDSASSENNRRLALEKEFNYNLEKKEAENKLLAQQNQIQNLQLNQNRYFLAGLGGLAVLISIIAYLIMRQNRLTATHQKMFLEQKLISSQMNPHFVFNSLNAIQHLIMAKENDKAENYLSKFANLIRELLESNTKESLTLEEEVTILNSFLEMESRRFSKSFNYHISVDKNLAAGKLNIPHMLVQPFIENSIWHGLLAKEGERILNVTFSYDSGETITCIIEDNGIGRAASSKKESTFKKKSLALSFVKQRLELLQETLKIACSVKIIDKVDAIGNAAGTKVIIKLPLIK